MKETIRAQCQRALDLNKDALENGSLTKSQVLGSLLASISHGRGWKIRVELEHEFGLA